MIFLPHLMQSLVVFARCTGASRLMSLFKFSVLATLFVPIPHDAGSFSALWLVAANPEFAIARSAFQIQVSPGPHGAALQVLVQQVFGCLLHDFVPFWDL